MMVNTVKHLLFILKSSQDELDDILNDIDQYYYEKVEIKLNKDGTPKLDASKQPKKRILHPSKGLLKHIQQMMLQKILNSIEVGDYAYGAVKGRDNVMNAKRHQGKKYIFTTDLKDFFPGITHRMVFEMFRLKGFSPTVSRLLTKLATYKGKVPQGAPTSPMIANLVFSKTGDKLNELAKTNNITFTSFIDDLTFSSSKDFKHLTQVFLEVIQEGKFRISHKKTNYKTKNPVVTGVLVKNNNIELTKAQKKKMQALEHLKQNQIDGLKQYEKKIRLTNR